MSNCIYPCTNTVCKVTSRELAIELSTIANLCDCKCTDMMSVN